MNAVPSLTSKCLWFWSF